MKSKLWALFVSMYIFLKSMASSAYVKTKYVSVKLFNISKRSKIMWKNLKVILSKSVTSIATGIKRVFRFIWDSTKNIRILIKDMLLVVILYGLLINFLTSYFFGWDFSYVSIGAWGLVSYIIKYELPEIIISIRGPKGPPMIKL